MLRALWASRYTAHLIHQTIKAAPLNSRLDIKNDLKKVYLATNIDEMVLVFNQLSSKYINAYPKIVDLREKNLFDISKYIIPPPPADKTITYTNFCPQEHYSLKCLEIKNELSP